MRRLLLLCMFAASWQSAALADDTDSAAGWARFRGPDGSGIGAETGLPLTWSSSENLRWRTALPGPGSSSPIVVGDRVFVTCYSGYGVERGDGSQLSDLKRHLVCVDHASGEVNWTATVPAELPEDLYEGFISEHGYASNTPVSDGQRVFAFFGKSGVVAYDLDGNELWRVDVGHESSSRRWGSGSSLVLVDDMVIVNASEESRSIRALDAATGEERWLSSANSLEMAYTTPTLVELADGSQELVLPVPNEVWGMNPATGKLRWYCSSNLGGNLSPMVLADGDTVYVFGGIRGAGSMAIRCGGRGDVTDSHTVWQSSTTSYVATPVLYEGHLYWADDRGTAWCMRASDGQTVYRERMPAGSGRPFYASPVLADGKIYLQSRWEGTFVLPAKPEFEILAQNRFEGDDSDANATPAIVEGGLLLRSNRFLYRVGAK